MKQVINLSKFSADSDMATFANAMQYMREHPGTTLLVPPGTYSLTGELARKAQRAVMAGEWGRNSQKVMFKPAYRYDKGLNVEGLENCCIEARGAVFVVDGFMEPVSLTNCRNVMLRGLTVDHLRKPYSRATVREISERQADGLCQCLLEFDPEFSICPNTPVDLRYFLHDEQKAQNIYVSMKKYHISDAYHMEVQFQDTNHCIREGMLFYTAHTFHSRPAILIEHCADVRLESITIHSQPGMGIVGNRSENVVISGLKVVPSEGQHMSTNTDATHFTSMKGLLKLENCVFEGQGDDFINVHGYYQEVVDREDACTCLIQEKTPTGTHAQTLDYPDVGDEMELTVLDTLQTLDCYKVIDCMPMPEKWMCRVVLDHPLPENTEGLVLSDITRMPHVEVTGCKAFRHYARSILLKNRSALVENNYFKDVMGPAIVAAAESWWYEGICPSNIIIRGNRIENCAMCWGQEAEIVIKADAPHATDTSIHNIVIEDNEIICPGIQGGIIMRNVDGGVIRNNRITTKGQEVQVTSCKNIQIV